MKSRSGTPRRKRRRHHTDSLLVEVVSAREIKRRKRVLPTPRQRRIRWTFFSITAIVLAIMLYGAARELGLF